jgi:arylformamidase
MLRRRTRAPTRWRLFPLLVLFVHFFLVFLRLVVVVQPDGCGPGHRSGLFRAPLNPSFRPEPSAAGGEAVKGVPLPANAYADRDPRAIVRRRSAAVMRRIDISMPLFRGMPSFPGDPPFDVTPLSSIARGDPYDLSGLSFGSHAGTHVDPVGHFVPGGATADQLDLEDLNGPCRVVDVDASATFVGADDVARIPTETARVLFRTANSARWASGLTFFSDYVGLAPAAADALVARKVRLVGIDALSIENDPTGSFPVHHSLLRRGTLILEGLLLAAAPAGEYRLECLPLRLRDGDGGPARATLVTLS